MIRNDDCMAIVPCCNIMTRQAVWMSQMSKREPESGAKLFIGPRFRRLRRQLGLSQTQMADELGVSPSYVNLIERNQRPVTAQILLKMAQAFDIHMLDLEAADQVRFFTELNEVFSDPLFRQIELPKQELRDLVELCPDAANAVQRLYRAYVEARRGESMAAARLAGRDDAPSQETNPVERVRDLIEANRNHFPALETAAETLRDELDAPAHELFRALSERLRERHGILVRILPVDVMRDTLRRYAQHRKQLLLSELLDGAGCVFQAAFQLALAEAKAPIDQIIAGSGALD